MECYCQKKQNHTAGGATLLCSILIKKKQKRLKNVQENLNNMITKLHTFFFFFKEKESYTNSLLNRLNVSDIFRTEYVSGNVPCLPMIVWEEDNERLHDL